MFKCNYGFVTSSVIFMAEINANTYLIFRRTCCRISEQVNEYLPEEGTTYRVHHPMLGRVSFYETRGTDKLSPYSINLLHKLSPVFRPTHPFVGINLHILQ